MEVQMPVGSTDPANAERFAAEAGQQNAPAPTNNTPAIPEGVPEKFVKDGVVDVAALAKSYAELEKRQSAPKPPVDPKNPAKIEPAPAEQAPTDQQAQDAVANAGLKMADLEAEFVKEGKLADESYTKLEKAGISRQMVDAYIAGQAALAQQTQQQVLKDVGINDEQFASLAEWARTSLSPAEIAAYNAAVDSQDPGQITLALRGLNARYTAEVGRDPTLVTGKSSTQPGDVYASRAEMVQDMMKPEYDKNPAFRAQVEAKIARSMRNLHA